MAAIQTSIAIPALKRFASKGSSYDFAGLRAGTEDCIAEMGVVNAGKAHARLSSAVVAYRKRSGSKDKFTVRTFKNAEGQDCVGVWKLATPEAAA
jgi:hypothetical protein